jgi:hypothetical protein
MSAQEGLSDDFHRPAAEHTVSRDAAVQEVVDSVLALVHEVAERRDGVSAHDVRQRAAAWLLRNASGLREAVGPPPAPEEGQDAERQPFGLLEVIGVNVVMEVAASTYPAPAQRDRVIRERLGVSPTRYFQLLNALLDSRAAVSRDPVTVYRLRRIRERRRVAREGGRP